MFICVLNNITVPLKWTKKLKQQNKNNQIEVSTACCFLYKDSSNWQLESCILRLVNEGKVWTKQGRDWTLRHSDTEV